MTLAASARGYRPAPRLRQAKAGLDGSGASRLTGGDIGRRAAMAQALLTVEGRSSC